MIICKEVKILTWTKSRLPPKAAATAFPTLLKANPVTLKISYKK